MRGSGQFFKQRVSVYKPQSLGILIIFGSLFSLLGFQSCATTSPRPAVSTETQDVTIKRLTRENDELKTKVDDLLNRLLKLSRLVDDHQVKLDYLADKIRTFDSSSSTGIQTHTGPQKGMERTGHAASSAAETQKDMGRGLTTTTQTESNPDKLYDQAHNEYRDSHYQEAIIQFKEFLLLFPQNNRASNAQYWIGESYYSLRDYDNAIQAFQLVLQNYPISSKIPDAMVKIGLCYLALEKKELAGLKFQQVIDQFPSSNAADIARQKLGQ